MFLSFYSGAYSSFRRYGLRPESSRNYILHSLKELLERNRNMSRPLLSIISTICGKYHPKSRSIKALKIISFTQTCGIYILLFRRKRYNFEHSFGEQNLFGIYQFSRFTSQFHIQRTIIS